MQEPREHGSADALSYNDIIHVHGLKLGLADKKNPACSFEAADRVRRSLHCMKQQSIYPDPCPFTVGAEFRCIHALDRCNAIAELTCMCYQQCILEYIGATSQEREIK